MATNVVRDIMHRTKSLSGKYTSTLEDLVSRDLCLEFKCVVEDEITVQDSSQMNPIPALACTFNPDGIHGNLLLLADEEGVARLVNTLKPLQDSLIQEWYAHRDAIFDGQWVSENKLVLGSGDGTCSLWDTCKVIKTGSLHRHQASVKSINVKRDSPDVLVTGGRDGRVLVWDTRCFARDKAYKPIHVIDHAHSKSNTFAKPFTRRQRATQVSSANTVSIDTSNGVTATLFYKDNLIATAGAADGTVKLWDKRKLSSSCSNSRSLFTFKVPESFSQRVHGFASLITDPSHAYLYAGCMDNMIYVFNGTSLETQYPVGGFSGHMSSSFYVKTSISPCGRFLLSGSSCGDAFIWDVKDPLAPPTLLTGHGQSKEVSAVAWAPNQFDKIVTCSDDCDVRVWRCGSSGISSVIGKSEEYRGIGHHKFSTLSRSYPVLQSVENITAPSSCNNATSNTNKSVSGQSPVPVPVAQVRRSKRKSSVSKQSPRTSKRQLNNSTNKPLCISGKMDRYLIKSNPVT